MSDVVWVVPVSPSSGLLQATRRSLAHLRIGHRVVKPSGVRGQLNHETPAVAVIHGGPFQPTVLSVQRRLVKADVPVLVLLEGLSDQHEAVLLGGGASDVVGIPTSARRLRSRLARMYRDRRLPVPPPVSPGGAISPHSSLDIHSQRRLVIVQGQPVNLTKIQFDLLLALANRPNDVLSPQELVTAAGQDGLSRRALESHLSRLRLRLQAAGSPRLVESVRGVGYRLGPGR